LTASASCCNTKHFARGLCKKCYFKEYIRNRHKNYPKKTHKTNDELIEYHKEYQKIYYEKNKWKIKERQKTYYEENIKALRKKNKEYSKEYYREPSNKKKHNDCMKEYFRKNRHVMAWRNILVGYLSRLNKKKDGKAENILGYTPKELKKHLESQFYEGMSWKNYGDWHVDHIRPVSTFPKDTPPEVVNSLDNLQPLWAAENISKGCSWDGSGWYDTRT